MSTADPADTYANNKKTPAVVGAAPAGYVNGEFIITTDEALEAQLNEYIAEMQDNTIRYVVARNAGGSTQLTGGRWFLLIQRDGAYYAQVLGVSGSNRGTIVLKNMYEGVWGEFEYVNPPMTLGKEYRTTERYNDKPVYVQTIKVEPLAVGSTSGTAQKYFHVGYGIADVVSHSGQYV